MLYIIWYPLKPSLSQAPSAMHVTHMYILPRRDKLNVKTTLTIKTSGHLKCNLSHFPSLKVTQPCKDAASSLQLLFSNGFKSQLLSAWHL